MSFHTPKKSLGQNFLTSIPARMKIVEAGDISPTDTILEIGPGKGFLTKGLLETGAHVVALEKDRDLIPLLSETFSLELAASQLTLIEGDVLTFDPSIYFSTSFSRHFLLKDDVPSTNLQANKLVLGANSPSLVAHEANDYKLIANIPYYITGAILSRYLSGVAQPSLMVVLVQKEVAERVCARDNKESLLSLSVKVYGDPKLYYRVSRGSFFPIPSVDSAVLQIKNISKKNFKHQYHEAMFFKLIHAGFAHKRKFALSNIKHVFPDVDIPSLFKEIGLSEKVRAEDVPLPVWLTISIQLTKSL